MNAGLEPIGHVESSLRERSGAPRQADATAPPAWLVLDPEVADGLADVRVGDVLIAVTWLDRARRDVLSVHPRGVREGPARGVFSTRSPDRPNPIGLHRVEVTAVDGLRLRVAHLEALDGTPLLDLKPARPDHRDD